VGREKPDPAIFEHALAVAGVEREACLHVGDLLSADVLGARAAGIEAVLLDPHGDWRDSEGDELRRLGCPTARDLLTLVAERLGRGR
jgi:putative hydrolase of the HAD superfamily